MHNGILDLFQLLVHISRNVSGRQITVNRKSLDVKPCVFRMATYKKVQLQGQKEENSVFARRSE